LGSTSVVAVFFAFERFDTKLEALFAAVAACLVLGLFGQAIAIFLAMRRMDGLEPDVRRGAYWCAVSRGALGAILANVLSVQLIFHSLWGFEHWHHWYFEQESVYHAFLLVLLIIANASAFRTARERNAQTWWRAAGAVARFLLATFWLALTLMWVLEIVALTHFAIRAIETQTPLVPSHDLSPDSLEHASSRLLLSLAISLVANCMAVASVRWLSTTWQIDVRRRLVAIGIFLAATALQLSVLYWAFGTVVPRLSRHLWENLPDEISRETALGGFSCSSASPPSPSAGHLTWMAAASMRP
jgi:hypothetical protein